MSPVSGPNSRSIWIRSNNREARIARVVASTESTTGTRIRVRFICDTSYQEGRH